MSIEYSYAWSIRLSAQRLAEYGYGPVWNGVVFSSFALSVVCASHFFNRFCGVDNGRAALMIVGLFLQGAGGLAFGTVPQFGKADCLFTVCSHHAVHAAVSCVSALLMHNS